MTKAKPGKDRLTRIRSLTTAQFDMFATVICIAHRLPTAIFMFVVISFHVAGYAVTSILPGCHARDSRKCFHTHTQH